MMLPHTRVRLIKRFGVYGGLESGHTGTYEGGADYVPGLDCGLHTVRLDKPDSTDRTACLHYTLAEVKEYWEPIPDNRCPWCGGEWTYEETGDAENGPELSVSCDNPNCPGDPDWPPEYDPADDADSELSPATGEVHPRRV